MKNILMIDLETTGTKPGCCILTIGAAGYNKNSEYVEFYKKIDYRIQLNAGFKNEQSTLNWWKNQDENVREEAFSGMEFPGNVAKEFYDFVKINFDIEKYFEAWSCGSDFDFPILNYLLDEWLIEWPWHYYSNRDYRTLKSLFPTIKNYEDNEKHHSSLEDAKAQLRGLKGYYRDLENSLLENHL